MKTCIKCNRELEVTQFSYKSKKKGTRVNTCKECHSAYRREHYIKNKQKYLEKARKKNAEYSKEKVKCVCGFCLKEFERSRKSSYGKSKSGFTFCSRECSTQFHFINSDYFCEFSYYLNNAKRRSELKNLQFDLDCDFLVSLWEMQQGKCQLTGLDLEINRAEKKHKNICYASLDRIDSDRGYTKDNVQFVALGINYMKMNFTNDQALEFIQLIRNSE